MCQSLRIPNPSLACLVDGGQAVPGGTSVSLGAACRLSPIVSMALGTLHCVTPLFDGRSAWRYPFLLGCPFPPHVTCTQALLCFMLHWLVALLLFVACLVDGRALSPTPNRAHVSQNVRGAAPSLKLYGEDGKVAEDLNIEGWSTDTVVEFLSARLAA